ncbi:MAG: magnesium/cobalt transporter CorA [Halobacteriota archaeon]
MNARQRPQGGTDRYVQRVQTRSATADDQSELYICTPKDPGSSRVRVVDYDARVFRETEIQDIDEVRSFLETPTVTWISIEGPNATVQLEAVQRVFNFHALVVKDIARTNHRPKVDIFEDYVFVVLRTLCYNDKMATVEGRQMSIVFGKHYVLTFTEGPSRIFDVLKQRIASNEERLRETGPDRLTYAIADLIVSQYFRVLEKLGERIEDLEDEVISSPGPATLQEVHKLKTELLYLRESTWPLREIVDRIEEAETPLVSEGTRPYFRDVYDEIIHIIDILETFRDIVSGVLDIYLSSINLKLQEVMKILTMVGTIFLPLAFIAGVYGMNFRYLPELGYQWGYPAFWLVCLAVALMMVAFFRRKHWL